MKNKLILILVMVSFFGFGQDGNFNNNKYFKLISRFKDKNDVLNSGYSEFDLKKSHWYGTNNIKRLQNKNTKLKGFTYFVSPNRKYLFGYKNVGKEDISLDSICFCDTSGTIYNILSTPENDELNSTLFFSNSSDYVFLPFIHQKKLYIYSVKGILKYNVALIVDNYPAYVFTSNNAENYLISENDDKRVGANLNFYSINGGKIWEKNIQEVFVFKASIYKNIIILLATEFKAKNRSNKRLIIIDKKTGNIIYQIYGIDYAYFIDNKFLINTKDKYTEYEVLN